MEFSLNVFTLNCWGIPVVSKNRIERIEAISKYLSEGGHNIVCLQEIWSEKDYLYLKENLKPVLPYSHYFYSGVLGSGLCVFSKWVIQDVFFPPMATKWIYPQNTPWRLVWREGRGFVPYQMR